MNDLNVQFNSSHIPFDITVHDNVKMMGTDHDYFKGSDNVRVFGIDHDYLTVFDNVRILGTDHSYCMVKPDKFVGNHMFEHNYCQLQLDDHTTSSQQNLTDQTFEENASIDTTCSTPIVSSGINLIAEHHLHGQWYEACDLPDHAVSRMKKFHSSLQQLNINQCEVCMEAWCHIKNVCGRCSRDKITPAKFSAGNNMIPSPVPVELQDLSQTEEMLIARAFPVMNIYCKPRGGQRAYKGHVITFPTSIQTIASTLPHCPRELPIVRLVSASGSYKSKDFRVRRNSVLNALRWLIENNPLCRNVIIDENRI